MFIQQPNPNKEMKVLLRGVKRNLGHVPPHWELFATINPTRFKMFLEEITYLSTHPNINPDFFALTRFYVSSKNGFWYCLEFNQALLLAKGFSLEELNRLQGEKHILPLDDKHQALFDGMRVAIETPEAFLLENIDELKTLGWSDADIFDAVDHGAFLFKFSKLLRAYSK